MSTVANTSTRSNSNRIHQTITKPLSKCHFLVNPDSSDTVSLLVHLFELLLDRHRRIFIPTFDFNIVRNSLLFLVLQFLFDFPLPCERRDFCLRLSVRKFNRVIEI